jgi:hypothetical protein
MKILLSASFALTFLLDIAYAIVFVAEAKHDAPHETFRSDSTLSKFMRRKARDKVKEHPHPNNPLEDVGEAAEDADEAATDPDTYTVPTTPKIPEVHVPDVTMPTTPEMPKVPDISTPKIPEVTMPPNPVEAAGKAAEEADKASGEMAVPFGNPIDAVGEAAEDADKAVRNGADNLGDLDSGIFEGGDSSKQGKQGDVQEELHGCEPSTYGCEPGKEVASVPGCRNSVKGWTDKKGQDCEDYEEGEWCTRFGGYGDGWLDDWPKFEELATNGRAATRVCCVCGGGIRSEEVGMIGGAPGPAPYYAAAPGPAITRPIRGLQSQGFMGDLVEHEDESTMTEDWGKEFGPASGHRDIALICREHKDNEWCLMHGYYDTYTKSSSHSLSMSSVIATALLIWLS